MEFVKPGVRLDFVGKRLYALVISIIAFILSLVSFAVPGPNWGIDFMGGTEVQIRFSKDIQVADLRTAVNSLNLGDVQIQKLGMMEEMGTGAQDFLIRVEKVETGEEETEGQENQEKPETEKQMQEEGEEDTEDRTYEHVRKRVSTLIEEKIRELAGAENYKILQVNYVGPKVGRELKQRGIQAVIYAIIGILIYVAFRFEFRFALGAVAALTHDALISTGIFVFLHRELNLPIVAALLAIIGYSVNDTIVIYDRIRENMKRLRRLSFIEMINVSVNETLSRTLLTSMTTLIAVLFLWILGGGIIRDFSLIMFVGIIIGTYSTIYIASSIIIFWEGMRARRRTVVETTPKKG
jgi:preprotein translocase subunit SecF